MSCVQYSDTSEFTFHNGATATAIGNELKVDYWRTLTVEFFGSSTNTARTFSFYGKGRSGTKRLIPGVKMSGDTDYTLATSTTGTGEIWQFDITGLESVTMELDSITGGNISVLGKLVA